MNILTRNKQYVRLPSEKASKSPSKSHHQASPLAVTNFNQANLEPLRVFEVPHLQALTEQFQKEIMGPIHTQTSIYLSKTPQRCLQHNNVTTLYCINDRKPLCVTCMYQTNTHKKHRVVPINRANQELQQQINSYLNSVGKDLQTISDAVIQTHSHLVRAEREFPQLIVRIQNFYLQLQEILTVKQKQQVDHIKQTWARMRYEYTSLSNQLEKINIYFREKVAEIKNRPEEEYLLFNRNVASQLAHFPEILPLNLCKYHETKYEGELQRFHQIKTIINNRLVFTSPFKEIINRPSSRKPSGSNPKKTPSPSPIRNIKNHLRKRSSDKNIEESKSDKIIRGKIQSSPITKNKSITKKNTQSGRLNKY